MIVQEEPLFPDRKTRAKFQHWQIFSNKPENSSLFSQQARWDFISGSVLWRGSENHFTYKLCFPWVIIIIIVCKSSAVFIALILFPHHIAVVEKIFYFPTSFTFSQPTSRAFYQQYDNVSVTSRRLMDGEWERKRRLFNGMAAQVIFICMLMKSSKSSRFTLRILKTDPRQSSNVDSIYTTTHNGAVFTFIPYVFYYDWKVHSVFRRRTLTFPSMSTESDESESERKTSGKLALGKVWERQKRARSSCRENSEHIHDDFLTELHFITFFPYDVKFQYFFLLMLLACAEFSLIRVRERIRLENTSRLDRIFNVRAVCCADES